MAPAFLPLFYFLLFFFFFAFHLPLCFSGESSAMESVPDLQNTMYKVIDGDPCVRLLNLSGPIGCANPGRDKVLAPIIGFENVDGMSESSAILVSFEDFPSLFNRISDDLSFASKVAGVLVKSRTDVQNNLKGFSPDQKFPQAQFAPYHNFSYEWNPIGLERSSIGVSDLRLFWELPSDFAIFIRDVKEGSFTRISRLLIFFSLETFEPQISDFGLAKWLPDQWTHHTVCKVESTFGYLPHKFFMHGIVDEKTDVYAYGVLLLELITGRQALDSSQKSLIMWAKPLLIANNIKELVDPVLEDNYDEEQMDLVILTASQCVEQSSAQRPLMSEVLQILRGDEESLKCIKERQKSKIQRTYSEELLDADEYNSKQKSQRARHMEFILSSNSPTQETEQN